MSSAVEFIRPEMHPTFELTQVLSDALAAIRARESSADGIVTVEVDGCGRLLGLTLTEEANQLSPIGFEQLVLETCAVATRRAVARRHALIEFANWAHNRL